MRRETPKDDSLLRRALSPSGACASPLELGALVDGSLAHSTATRLRDHVWRCARCQTELALLKQFEDAVPAPEEERVVKSISARLERRFSQPPAGVAPLHIDRKAPLHRRSWFGAATVGGFAVAAASLAIALTIGLRESRPPELTATSAAASAVLRSARIAAVFPAGELDSAPGELRWERLPVAASYSVRVMEVDRVGLWSADTHEAAIALPQALRAKIVPGKPLVWEVVAKDAAGRTVASSGEQQFKVRM